jgi:hypothetical protein
MLDKIQKLVIIFKNDHRLNRTMLHLKNQIQNKMKKERSRTNSYLREKAHVSLKVHGCQNFKNQKNLKKSII